MRILALLLMTVGVVVAAAPPETRVLMLSGHGNDDGVPWEFQCTAGRNSGNWTTIPVPSSWECQGFGSFGYQKDPTPVEQGQYRRTFMVSAEWQGQHIRVVFEGVQTDTQVRINGQSAGDRHIGGFYRFSYDITALAKPGVENRIEVEVDKRSSDESVNRAERTGDYWNFSGIFRPVYLECDPPRHVVRVAIDAKADGAFAMDVVSGGSGVSDQVEAQIQQCDGTPVGVRFTAPLAENGLAHLTNVIANPRTWSAETPALYQVEVRLVRGAQVLHRKIQRFGFRTIEMRQNEGVYVNGQRIILQGSCRHSFWPDSGRCTSVQLSRSDIRMMKEMNANAVRMSHYPPDQHFLDLCDEMGLYVLDELAGWGAGSKHQCYATLIGKKLVEEMVIRDVNHPSILMWDNGNEGGWNTDLDDEFAKWDPQHRHIIHPWAPFRGLNTKHYPTYAHLQKIATESDVFMPTEFLHALFDGGGGAGMEDYWPILRGPRGAGGFVWAWVDECVRRPDKNGQLDGEGNRAPDGIVGPYREKEASYFTLMRLWSPVQIPSTDLPKETSFTLAVENRYAFTDLKDCRFAWQLRRLNVPTANQSGHQIMIQGLIPAPSVPPGGTGRLHIELPDDRQGADVLAVIAYDPSGMELWTWTWALPATLLAPNSASTGTVTCREEPSVLVLSAGTLRVHIDRHTGYLAEVRRGDQVFPLMNGPRPVVGSATLTDLSHRLDGNAQVVEARYSGDLVRTQWRLGGDGWLQIEYTYRHEGPVSYLGVGFDLPDAAQWPSDSVVNH